MVDLSDFVHLAPNSESDGSRPTGFEMFVHFCADEEVKKTYFPLLSHVAFTDVIFLSIFITGNHWLGSI